jgi:outer membrane biogenesis lipoprotein LolB
MMPATFFQAVDKLNNKYRHYILISLALVFTACSKKAAEDEAAISATADVDPVLSALQQGLALIDREGIEAHLKYLADDAHDRDAGI